MKHKIVIKEADYKDSIYNTKEWNRSVKVITWEHNFETKEYIIHYEREMKEYND